MGENVKHTPGPWRVGHRAIDVGCENERIGGYAKLFDVRGWGYLTGHGEGALGLTAEAAYEIQKANAYLAAAAPELLRVAELLVDWLDEEEGAHKLCDAARAAIAKAEGRP
ncbi:hypothetical protein [Shinella zoogloeoides]|uniref:hypothetical protein n=1 Tax=Shinella zoogloeoides TaxID=352475 RepID=UPI0028A8F956|nr:hypothetical protein [Shinella zoogloeoides]